MMNNNNPRVLRKTLIYLHLNGFNDNNKILLEMMHKSQKITQEEVEKWLEDNHINPDNYYTILDDNYPHELYSWEDAPYVIEKVVIDNKPIN